MNATPNAALLVIYTGHLEQRRAFYTGLGLQFVVERHGTGPKHYATELDGGLTLELYPAHRAPASFLESPRFGAGTDAVDLAPGHHVLEAPDGSAVDVHVEGIT